MQGTVRGPAPSETARAIRQLEETLAVLTGQCHVHEQRIRASLARVQTTLYVTFPNELAALDELEITAEETSSAMLMASSGSLPILQTRLRSARENADAALDAFQASLGTDPLGTDLALRVDAVKAQLVKDKQQFERSMRKSNRVKRWLWYGLYASAAIICTLILIGYHSRN